MSDLFEPNDGIDGIDGPQGPEGPQGPVGPQGATGAQGPQGTVGPVGPQGALGPRGATGARAVDGADGLDGLTGPQGPRGFQGVQGPQGKKGARGDDGTRGPSGGGGAAGMMGVQGAQGPQGPAGGGGGGPFVDLEVTNDLTVGNVIHAAIISADGNIQILATDTGNVLVEGAQGVVIEADTGGIALLGGAAGVVIEADEGSIALLGDELTFNGNPIRGTVVVDAAPANPLSGRYTIEVTGAPTGGTFTLHLGIREPDDETNLLAIVETDTDPIGFDADTATIAAAILAAVVAAGWPGASIGDDGPEVNLEFPALIDITLGDNDLTGGTSPDVTVNEESPAGTNGTRGYPLATTLLSTDSEALYTNFGGVGLDVNGDGDAPVWRPTSIGPNGLFFPAETPGDNVFKIGPAGLEIYAPDDLAMPLFFIQAGGHVRMSDIDTQIEGRSSFETQVIEGTADDDYIGILDAPGLHRSELATVTTQVGTVDVAAFNAVRDALIKLGAILDGD